jgi:hypothetical protein
MNAGCSFRAPNKLYRRRLASSPTAVVVRLPCGGLMNRRGSICRPVAIQPHRQNPLGTPWARLRPPTLGTCIERYDIFDGLICKDRRSVNPHLTRDALDARKRGMGATPALGRGVVSSIFLSTFMYQFFKRRHQTAEPERWPFVRVFRWAFPVKEILHGPARLGTFGQATARA